MRREARTTLRAAFCLVVVIAAACLVSLPAQAAPDTAVNVRHDVIAFGVDLAHDLGAALGLPEGGRASYLAVAWKPRVIALKLLLIAFGTLIALAAAFAVPGAVIRGSAGLSGRIGRMTLVGLLFHASVALTAVLFTALIVIFVGLPLLGLLLVIVTLFESIALAAAFHHLGERILSRRQPAGTRGYAKILLGALVIGAVSLVPIAGEIAWCLVSCAGAGAILATWLPSRNPLLTRP